MPEKENKTSPDRQHSAKQEGLLPASDARNVPLAGLSPNALQLKESQEENKEQLGLEPPNLKLSSVGSGESPTPPNGGSEATPIQRESADIIPRAKFKTFTGSKMPVQRKEIAVQNFSSAIRGKNPPADTRASDVVQGKFPNGNAGWSSNMQQIAGNDAITLESWEMLIGFLGGDEPNKYNTVLEEERLLINGVPFSLDYLNSFLEAETAPGDLTTRLRNTAQQLLMETEESSEGKGKDNKVVSITDSLEDQEDLGSDTTTQLELTETMSATITEAVLDFSGKLSLEPRETTKILAMAKKTSLFMLQKVGKKEVFEEGLVKMLEHILHENDRIKGVVALHQWREQYGEQYSSAKVDQSNLLKDKQFEKIEGIDEVQGGICFAACIHWIKRVMKEPRLKASAVIADLYNPEILQGIVKRQIKHKDRSKQQRFAEGQLSSEEFGKLGMKEDFRTNKPEPRENINELFGKYYLGNFLKDVFESKKPRYFILNLSWDDMPVGHAIGIQIRRKKASKLMQFNLFDVNDLVFKSKNVTLENFQETVATPIREYLAAKYPTYDSWSFMEYAKA